jgi:cytochrome c
MRNDGVEGRNLFLMSNSFRLIITAAFLCQFAGPARSGGGSHTLGKRLAQEWCAKCHAIGRFGASPLPEAPPFSDLHSRYNVEDLAESLAEGIMTGHPSMPAFRFDPDQIENLIAYLKTLEKQ